MTVEIGSKWTPEHRVIKDEKTGEFQEVNPRMDDENDLTIQAALLYRARWPSDVSDWLRMNAEQAASDEYQRSVLAEHSSMTIREDR